MKMVQTWSHITLYGKVWYAQVPEWTVTMDITAQEEEGLAPNRAKSLNMSQVNRSHWE